MSTLVEYSKSNSAICKNPKCKCDSQYIVKGDIRFKVPGLGFVHKQCFPKDTNISLENLAGLKSLSSEDQRVVELLLTSELPVKQPLEESRGAVDSKQAFLFLLQSILAAALFSVQTAAAEGGEAGYTLLSEELRKIIRQMSQVGSPHTKSSTAMPTPLTSSTSSTVPYGGHATGATPSTTSSLNTAIVGASHSAEVTPMTHEDLISPSSAQKRRRSHMQEVPVVMQKENQQDTQDADFLRHAPEATTAMSGISISPEQSEAQDPHSLTQPAPSQNLRSSPLPGQPLLGAPPTAKHARIINAASASATDKRRTSKGEAHQLLQAAAVQSSPDGLLPRAWTDRVRKSVGSAEKLQQHQTEISSSSNASGSTPVGLKEVAEDSVLTTTIPTPVLAAAERMQGRRVSKGQLQVEATLRSSSSSATGQANASLPRNRRRDSLELARERAVPHSRLSVSMAGLGSPVPVPVRRAAYLPAQPISVATKKRTVAPHSLIDPIDEVDDGTVAESCAAKSPPEAHHTVPASASSSSSSSAAPSSNAPKLETLRDLLRASTAERRKAQTLPLPRFNSATSAQLAKQPLSQSMKTGTGSGDK